MARKSFKVPIIFTVFPRTWSIFPTFLAGSNSFRDSVPKPSLSDIIGQAVYGFGIAGGLKYKMGNDLAMFSFQIYKKIINVSGGDECPFCLCG